MINQPLLVQLPSSVLWDWFRFRFASSVETDSSPVYGPPPESFERFLDEHDRFKSNMRALDIACGDGKYSLKLAEKGFQVTAVDLLPEALERARKLARVRGVEHRIKFVRGTVPSVIANLGSFDVIVCGSCFLHLLGRKTTRETLKEMANATNPGGFNYVSLSTEISRCLKNGQFFGYEGEASFSLEESQMMISSAYQQWRIVDKFVTAIDETWDIPSVAKHLLLRGDSYQRKEKEAVFVTERLTN